MADLVQIRGQALRGDSLNAAHFTARRKRPDLQPAFPRTARARISGRLAFLTKDNVAPHGRLDYLLNENVGPHTGFDVLPNKSAKKHLGLEILTSENVWTHALLPRFCGARTPERHGPKSNFLPVGNLIRKSSHYFLPVGN